MDIQRGKNGQLMGKSVYLILNFQINCPWKFKTGKNGYFRASSYDKSLKSNKACFHEIKFCISTTMRSVITQMRSECN